MSVLLARTNYSSSGQAAPTCFTEQVRAPRDEYECLVGSLMRHLEQKDPDEVISSFLEHEFADHLGCRIFPAEAERQQFIQRARSWFSEYWRDSRV